MGPLYFLLEHGANIIAVDLNRDFIWKKLLNAVKGSSGKLIFPVKTDVDDDDIDKLDINELAKVIANWLTDVIKTNVPWDKSLTNGNYTYLDSALHVELSLACDGIIKRICDERKDPIIAFLCTPTGILYGYFHTEISGIFLFKKQYIDDHVVTT